MALYILDSNRNAVAAASPAVWAAWMAVNTNVVSKKTTLASPSGPVVVLTVFLGTDHNYFVSGQPILWATFVSGVSWDGYKERFMTEAEALDFHDKAVRRIFDGLVVAVRDKITDWSVGSDQGDATRIADAEDFIRRASVAFKANVDALMPAQ